MTLDEFIKLLEKTPREWGFSDISRIPNSIRIFNGARNKTYCPITFVAKMITGTDYDIGYFHDAGKSLNLSNSTINLIVNSADTEEYERDSIRPRLMRACGLEVKEVEIKDEVTS